MAAERTRQATTETVRSAEEVERLMTPPGVALKMSLEIQFVPGATSTKTLQKRFSNIPTAYSTGDFP
jgi:hypothetical protein